MDSNSLSQDSPSQASPPQSPSDDNPLARRLVIAGFSALLLLPLVMYGGGPEWARWDAAQAVIAYDQGDIEHAIFQLTTAVERSPRDPSLKISLARKLIESGRGKEAEELCDEILARFPDNDPALVTKATSQQAQGNFRLALDTFNLRARQLNWTIGRNPVQLNERAYFRALAGVQLEDAKQDINLACEIISHWSFGSLPRSLGLFQRSLAASSIVAMEIGMTQQAVPHLAEEIDGLRRALHELNTELNREIIELTALEYPPSQEKANSQNGFRDRIRASEHTLATLLTIRALAYQQLGLDDLCDQDRAEVRGLGLDCDEIAAALPASSLCIGTIKDSSAYLDTRGYIIGLMPTGGNQGAIELNDRTVGVRDDFEDALRDLNQSIFALEVFEESLSSSIHNHAEGTVQDPVAERQSIGKQKAVLLYHRLMMREKSGNQDGAKQDSEAIKALGCQPGTHLF